MMNTLKLSKTPSQLEKERAESLKIKDKKELQNKFSLTQKKRKLFWDMVMKASELEE